MSDGMLAPLIGSIAMLLIASGTILLWPLSRRVGELLDVLIQEKRHRADEVSSSALERIEQRIARIEERQLFTESLIEPKRGAEALRPNLVRAADP